MANETKDDIDYDLEGGAPPHEKEDPTNAGYDEAAHQGAAYGRREGRGGVFGTSGGGTYPRGLHVEERPVAPNDRNDSDEDAAGDGNDGAPRKTR